MTPQLSSKSCLFQQPRTITDHGTGKASSQFQQKVSALYRADTMTERHHPQQLDSREIGRYERHRQGSIGRFAELPAEPLPWPGNSGGN
jgi:hypothetical protein